MYEWNEEKNQKNIIERGLNFVDAEIVFSGTCATFEDTRNVGWSYDCYSTYAAW